MIGKRKQSNRQRWPHDDAEPYTFTQEDHPLLKDSPHPSILKSVIIGCFSPQDDATLKCWGWNDYGQLGLGDKERGNLPNGPCPQSSTTALSRAAPTCPDPCSCSLCAEMGTNLPSVELGAGRTAVAGSAGLFHMCVLLVRLHLEWSIRTPHAESQSVLNLSRRNTD
jgi:hypothetical protein